MKLGGKKFAEIADKISELEKMLYEAKDELANFEDNFEDTLWQKIQSKTKYLRESGLSVETDIARKEIFVREMGCYEPVLYNGNLNGFKFVIRLRPTELNEVVVKVIKDSIYESTLDWDLR